jgi:hypothetical protein
MQAEKDTVLETAFPLLAAGGNGKEGQAQQPAATKPSASLESLLGGKE